MLNKDGPNTALKKVKILYTRSFDIIDIPHKLSLKIYFTFFIFLLFQLSVLLAVFAF